MRYPDHYEYEIPLDEIEWDIRREGRRWTGDEGLKSWYALPEKMELVQGQLCFEEDERLRIIGALLENVGIDRVIRLGDPSLWRAAVAELPE